MKLLRFFYLLLPAFSLGCAQAQIAPDNATVATEAATPPVLSGAVADEPHSPRASNGLTLWHLSHDPARVREFHAWLRARGQNPQQLGPTASTQAQQTLLDFANTPERSRGGWHPEGRAFVTGWNEFQAPADAPLHLSGGTVHLWVRVRVYADGLAPTALKIYKRGRENLHPLWEDELAQTPAPADGLAWHDVLLTLPAGDYTVRLQAFGAGWRAGFPNSGRRGRTRQVDFLYLTSQLGATAPDDAALESLRAITPEPGRVQHDATVSLSANAQNLERAWQSRPLDYAAGAAHPQLFALGYAFWRDTLTRLETRPVGADPRDETRQIIFDDAWNLLGAPSDVAVFRRALAEAANAARDRSRARRAGLVADASQCVAWTQPDPLLPPFSPDPSNEANWPQKRVGALQLRLVLPRDGANGTRLNLRNLSAQPQTYTLRAAPLSGTAGRFSNVVTVRVIASAARAPGIGSWRGWVLLRRPYVTLQPGVPTSLWISVDARGLPPGDYTSRVRWTNADGQSGSALVSVRVSPVRAAPRQPILAMGYSQPPEGDDYLRDAVRHGFNVAVEQMLTRAQMNVFGIRKLYLTPNAGSREGFSAQLQQLRANNVDLSDVLFRISDEPAGNTPQELEKFLRAGRLVHDVEPRAQTIYNPRDFAGQRTFEILDEVADWWNPYINHLMDAGRANERAIFERKPYLFYRVTAYSDASPFLPSDVRGMARVVPTLGGNPRGVSYYVLYRPGHDAWDNARKGVRDDAAFVLPGRFGPVATLSYEAIQAGVQDANLAQLVKEANGPANLVRSGATPELLDWLEAHNAE